MLLTPQTNQKESTIYTTLTDKGYYTLIDDRFDEINSIVDKLRNVQLTSWDVTEIFTNTSVGKDFRYICRLPFKENWSLGKSRHVAIANLLSLERRFRQNEELDRCKVMNYAFSCSAQNELF